MLKHPFPAVGIELRHAGQCSGYSVKWSCISKAALKHSVDRTPRHAWELAVGVHANRQLGAPPDAALVLAADAEVPPEQLLLEVAVPAQAGRADLAAGVVLAVAPVQVGCSAVVVGVDQLVRQRVADLLLRGHMVAAHHHLQAQDSLQLAAFMKTSPHLTSPYILPKIAYELPHPRKNQSKDLTDSHVHVIKIACAMAVPILGPCILSAPFPLLLSAHSSLPGAH